MRKLERRAAKEGASDEKIDQADVSPATVSLPSHLDLTTRPATFCRSDLVLCSTRSSDAGRCCHQDAANPKEFLIDLIAEGSKDSRAVDQAA